MGEQKSCSLFFLVRKTHKQLEKRRRVCCLVRYFGIATVGQESDTERLEHGVINVHGWTGW